MITPLLTRCLPPALVTATLCATFLTPSAAAQPHPHPAPDADRATTVLDDLIPTALDEHQIPGAAIALSLPNQQTIAAGYGTANLATNTPVDAETTGFFLGSVAKVITATAVLQQVEQGTLDLDTDVNDYLSDTPVHDPYPDHPLTLRHLLTHTAGFDATLIGAGAATGEDAVPLAEYLADPPRRVRPPGELVSYDNYAVALAGHVLEVATGQPFPDYLDTHVFQPLGMDNTTFAQPTPPRLRDTLAHGYRNTDTGHTRTYGQYGGMTPTGSGAISTATDMIAFGRAHLPNAENPLLTPDTTREMQEQQAGDPRLPGIGHLWELRDHNGHRLVTKGGDLPGFHTSLTLVPAEDTVLYLAFNGDGDDGAASTLTTTLANSIIDELFPHPTGGTEDPPAADLPTPATFTGTFRSSRESRTEPHGIQALVAAVTISLAEDGRLRTQGPLSHDVDPDGQTWTQTAPGLFQQDDGAERIAFSEDGRHLQVGSAPIVTFERLAWYESPGPHLAIIAVATLLALATALGLPAVTLVRRRRRRRTPPALNRAARAGRWATWLASCALIGVLLALVALLVDGSAINEVLFLGNSLALALLPWIGGVLVVGVVASLALVSTAWYRRWWGVGERCHHSVTVLALVAFVLVGHHYGILG